MENSEILPLLETINQQVRSAILGGMLVKYEDLEVLGLVRLDTHRAQWFATLTEKGQAFLENQPSH